MAEKKNPLDIGRFTVWSGDVDPLSYGGTWHWSPRKGEHHFIKLYNWEDMCGSDAPEETYNISLGVVVLAAIPTSIQRQAIKSCGWSFSNWLHDKPDLCSRGVLAAEAVSWLDALHNGRAEGEVATACFEYGAHAPMFDANTSNWRRTFAEAARVSRETADDGGSLDRGAVNGIGQTPREYMTGEMGAALARGVAAEDPTARLVLKMYEATEGKTLGGHIDQHEPKVKVMDVP